MRCQPNRDYVSNGETATGNGSITNFPFVPTLKFTSTTRRH